MVVMPSSVIDTSLTTVLPDDEPPLPDELSDVLPDELVAVVADVDGVDWVAEADWAEPVLTAVVTELIDMEVSHQEEGQRCADAQLVS
ncbi:MULTISPECIES: hypothetical protein [unclassified Bradyrhizobium]|uniref:hypothetical protein n=1 Tax=unclassified Bradyrhizobium TaxID=2631580 RepID=UPI0028EB5FD5|nr:MULTISPECIES: hypothetical protein [unclassified Bradyrhizobium]